MSLIVYGSSKSSYVRKVLVFLEEKGLDYERRGLPGTAGGEEFEAASPLGKAPALADGDYRLGDSSAICHYIETRYPEPRLFPEDAAQRGRMVWFDELADTELVPVVDKLVLQLVTRPKLLRQVPDLGIVEKVVGEELPALFDYLEGAVNGPFLIGERLSLADIAVAAPFIDLARLGRPLDGQRWRKLATYLEAIHARPAFGAVADE